MPAQKSNPKDISLKNTKNDILAAYEALLNERKEIYKQSKQQQLELENQRTIIENAKGQAPKDIQQHLIELRQQINEKLNNISEQIEDEMQRLKNIQEAISLEEKNLKEMYDINKTAHTLDALLLTQKQQQENFQQEMDERKQRWEKEQESFEQNLKEEQERLQKLWKREQDEYTYRTKTERHKDQDEYLARKAQQESELQQYRENLENEFAMRESDISSREEELKELKEKVSTFPEKLQLAIQEAEQETTQRLEREHKFQFDLLAREREGENRLNAQTIESLERKIHSQEQLIQQLSEKANRSVTQVQDIAVKAIEGASVSRSVYYPSDNKVKPVETVDG